MVLWRRIDDLSGEDEDVRRWSFTVALKLLANRRRGDARRSRLAIRLASSGRARRLTSAGMPDDRLVAGEAWQSLTPQQQDLLLSRSWAGVSNDELASSEGCSAQAIEMRISRARRRLAQTLCEDLPVPDIYEVVG